MDRDYAIECIEIYDYAKCRLRKVAGVGFVLYTAAIVKPPYVCLVSGILHPRDRLDILPGRTRSDEVTKYFR